MFQSLNMLRLVFTLLLVILEVTSISQFSFCGEVSKEFKNGKAYLVLVEDYKKSNLLLSENIIAESRIDSNYRFSFSGNYLKDYNQYYNIYVDNCNNSINDSKHLLNKCDSQISRLFVANNCDSINFPLNGLNQMLCTLNSASNETKNNLAKIDSLQEELLSDHCLTINDAQRNIIYTNYFKELKSFSSSMNEPLAELYAYGIYSGENSFSRTQYLKDLKTSDYYHELLARMEVVYPNSPYTSQLKKDLEQDVYFESQAGVSIYKTLTFSLGTLLLIAISLIIVLLKKTKESEISIDYKQVLTSQELKVFGLMKQQLSNKEIADNLFVSVSTIKSHINNIYTKLSIKSRKEIENFS